MIVYKITNLVNGKIYVGLTKNSLSKRFNSHKHIALNQPEVGSALYSAMRKYGFDNFTIEPLEECLSKEELGLAEDRWIKNLNTMTPNGYNMKSGGFIGIEISDEIRAKMGAKNIGRNKTEKELELLRLANLGEKNGFYGKKHTKESIDRANRARALIRANKSPEEISAQHQKIANKLRGRKRHKHVIDKVAASHRKTHYLKSPDGQVFEINDLYYFCSKFTLSYSGLGHVSCGHKKSWRKWTKSSKEEYINYLNLNSVKENTSLILVDE